VPQHLRRDHRVRHDQGQLEIVCTLLDHDAPSDSLAHLHRALTFKFAGDLAPHMQGQASDGNVRLLFPSRFQ